MIAARTKAALAAAKARGVVLGNPRLDEIRGRAVRRARPDGTLILDKRNYLQAEQPPVKQAGDVVL
jgi:hypothetical protein